MNLNFDYLNKMINYIENNLDNDIDLTKLSKITNTNLFILERIFMFLTNMTIIEYIKKRRLSKAFEEIRNTNNKIIDIAFKYQYNSASTFNRAFKKLFGITPTECRRSTGEYKIFPMCYFEENKKEHNFNYQIKKINHKKIYCYHISANNHSELLYEIKKLYKNIKSNGYYDIFNKAGMYGISFKDNNTFHYYLGSEKYDKTLEQYNIKKKKYIVFSLNSRSQNDIVNLEEKINKQWIPSTNYNIKNNTKIEFYHNNTCYICLPIE